MMFALISNKGIQCYRIHTSTWIWDFLLRLFLDDSVVTYINLREETQVPPPPWSKILTKGTLKVTGQCPLDNYLDTMNKTGKGLQEIEDQRTEIRSDKTELGISKIYLLTTGAFRFGMKYRTLLKKKIVKRSLGQNLKKMQTNEES